MEESTQQCTMLCRHTLEELEQLVEAAKDAVPGVDAAIAAAIDRKVNPVSHFPYASAQLLLLCFMFGILLCT